MVAAIGLSVTLSAAHWQFQRAAYKKALSAQYAQRQAEAPVPAGREEPADMQFRRVQATGEFDPERVVFLDNRLRAGRVGFEVIMPLRLQRQAGYVLVDRGWVAGEHNNPRQPPPIVTPAGTVTVRGSAFTPSARVFELSPQPAGERVWQHVTPQRFAGAYGIALRHYLIQQENDSGDGLNRQWPPQPFGIERHQSYAVQWLVFASFVVVFYVYFGFFHRSSQAQ
jgi:surfeit locus 1 family protein